MQASSEDSLTSVKVIDFGCIAVDTAMEKCLNVENTLTESLSYRVTSLYILNNVDRVFNISITSTPVEPGHSARIKIVFKPNVVGQSFTEYFLVDDIAGNNYRLTVTGKCYGPQVCLNQRKIVFNICKNVNEQRKAVINIVNNSAVDTTYQWYIPFGGQGYFQISTGNCGLITAFETISTTVLFIGTALGVYTAELVCLVLNQEPVFLNVYGTVVLPGNPLYNLQDHVFEKSFKKKSRYVHLMENSLTRLTYIPSASVFERCLDYGTGSVDQVIKNISHTLCVTNHEDEEGYIQWMPDPDNIFYIDPIASVLPPNESRLFTVRFRPKLSNEVYGYLMCGDFEVKYYPEDKDGEYKLKHTWFRIPCTGNTWSPCTEWMTEYDCPNEVILPPTVPTRTTFANFMLSNKYEIPMHFKFDPPQGTNFVVMPLCGIVQGRGWQIISVALEPMRLGDYCETWDLNINKVQNTRVCFTGNAEISQIEVMSHGYHPETRAMLEFQPTITGCTNFITSYLHNLTRMEIHIRVLNFVPWLGADFHGSFVLPPKEIFSYHWWFFPKIHDKVYETTITLSCVCLINGRPVGEPVDVYINISGFSELPDLKVLPKRTNLHDIIVGDSKSISVTLYNYGSCYYTSKLHHFIEGMGDDHNGDRFDIECNVNGLKPSKHCEVEFTVTPNGAGPRQITVKYTVLFRTEYDEIEEIQPVDITICTIWYDGIYPTLKDNLLSAMPAKRKFSTHYKNVKAKRSRNKITENEENLQAETPSNTATRCIEVKRTISVKCPIILSNHDLWNMFNIDEFNKALEDCRPNIPLSVNLYAPDLCVRPGRSGEVKIVFVLGCLYRTPVAWHLRREKICDCEMVEVKVGTSLYEMRHNCLHRTYIEFYPLSGIVSQDNPNLLHLQFKYEVEGLNTLCYILTMPNQRVIYIYIKLYAATNTRSVLVPLRRPIGKEQYLAVLDCGRVPINNLDPVIRVIWLYNPTDVFTTWRLLRGNTTIKDSKDVLSTIRCLLFFAEVPPLGKLAIPIAFMPSEMIDYEVILFSSFGYESVKILVKGQGGLPNCLENRLDLPLYTERVIREVYRNELVFLSVENFVIPPMPTHSLCRDLICICNDTDHHMRFIWLPERIANIVNIVMTPCWGVVQPKSSEWITMTVYSLQEPSTFTTTVACEILDLTERKRYQQNEYLRKNKIEKCNQEFIITEQGKTHPDINDSPPYVLDLRKPQPFYLTFTVSISSKGQRDGYTRMNLRQLWEQAPPYNLLSSDTITVYNERPPSNNSLTMIDIVRIIDGILWDALHSKMFRYQVEYYAKEELPTYNQMVTKMEKEEKPRLARRMTSGICDAIVNKAIFHTYGLHNKEDITILDAE